VIEVLGLKGALHLARIQTHTSAGKYECPRAVGVHVLWLSHVLKKCRGIRLAQGKSITFVVQQPMPVQIDGEPWMMAVGKTTISHRDQVQLNSLLMPTIHSPYPKKRPICCTIPKPKMLRRRKLCSTGKALTPERGLSQTLLRIGK